MEPDLRKLETLEQAIGESLTASGRAEGVRGLLEGAPSREGGHRTETSLQVVLRWQVTSCAGRVLFGK